MTGIRQAWQGRGRRGGVGLWKWQARERRVKVFRHAGTETGETRVGGWSRAESGRKMTRDTGQQEERVGQVQQVRYITIRDGSWVRSGQCTRLEIHHLIIRTNLTEWWPLRTTPTENTSLRFVTPPVRGYHETFYDLILHHTLSRHLPNHIQSFGGVLLPCPPMPPIINQSQENPRHKKPLNEFQFYPSYCLFKYLIYVLLTWDRVLERNWQKINLLSPPPLSWYKPWSGIFFFPVQFHAEYPNPVLRWKIMSWVDRIMHMTVGKGIPKAWSVRKYKLHVIKC